MENLNDSKETLEFFKNKSLILKKQMEKKNMKICCLMCTTSIFVIFCFFLLLIPPILSIIIGSKNLDAVACGDRGKFNASHWLVVGGSITLGLMVIMTFLDLMDKNKGYEILEVFNTLFDIVWLFYGVHLLVKFTDECENNYYGVFVMTIFMITLYALFTVCNISYYCYQKWRK